ncbi:hypothetical protein OURE66S_01395 [Oligella ureolytica]
MLKATRLASCLISRMFNLLMEIKAGAVIPPQAGVDKLPETVPFVAIVCEDPYLLYARISHHFDRLTHRSNS